MFDVLFPRSSKRFSSFDLDARSWREGFRGEEFSGDDVQWTLALYADDLMRRLASFHGTGDVFLSYKFYGKLRLFREERAMATKTKVKDGIKQSDKAVWVGFLDYRLSESELEELDAWKPKPSDVWLNVDGAVQTGYRFTLSWNARTHLASCTMIDDDGNRKTGGYALSSSDEDGAAALKMMIFKHLKLQGDWSPLLSVEPSKGKRG